MGITKFQALMAKRNITTSELMRQMKLKAGFKVCRQTISRWRTGVTVPNGDSLYALIEIFGEDDVLKAFGSTE